MNAEFVREIFVRKKTAWSKTDSDHPRPGGGFYPWGDLEGHTLAPPMEVAAVDAWERSHDITLPLDFKQYITEVSAEVFVGGHPVTVALPLIIGGCGVVNSAYSDDCDCKDDCKCGSILDSSIRVRDDGQSQSRLMVTTRSIGSVYSTEDGNTWTLEHDSFRKFVEVGAFMEYLASHAPLTSPAS